MELYELESWADEFEAYHARFADLFRRAEPREQSRKYLRALLSAVERKNGWQLAEAGGDERPDATQRLLYLAQWDADAARDPLGAAAAVCRRSLWRRRGDRRGR